MNMCIPMRVIGKFAPKMPMVIFIFDTLDNRPWSIGITARSSSLFFYHYPQYTPNGCVLQVFFNFRLIIIIVVYQDAFIRNPDFVQKGTHRLIYYLTSHFPCYPSILMQ